MPMFRLELIMPGLARFLRVVLVTTALCSMAALPRLGLAQNKGKTARSGARTLLKSERDYLSAVGSDDSPLKTGAKVELIFQNGKRQEGMVFFFSSRRRHTRWTGDWSSDVCSSD